MQKLAVLALRIYWQWLWEVEKNQEQMQLMISQFSQQKYFLDVSKCDEAVKKLNSALAAISARVINGKYMPKFDFKRKTSNNTSMTSIKRTSCGNSDSGRDSPLLSKKVSKQASMLD